LVHTIDNRVRWKSGNILSSDFEGVLEAIDRVRDPKIKCAKTNDIEDWSELVFRQ